MFWIQVGAMLHTYVTYPISLRLLRRRFPVPPELAETELPSVAVLIPVHNEDAVIRQKLTNTLELDYPRERLQILVGSDGCTDRTCEIVRTFSDERIKLFELVGRNGKSAVLNCLAAQTDADLLISTDANVSLAPAAIRKLVRHFADPAVGAVSGSKHVQVSADAKSVRGEAVYSDFENSLKALESGLGGVSGCRGALVARRRTDFVPFRPGTINDDLITALETVRAGKRVVFDPEAKASEDSAGSVRQEFRRRVRIGTGNVQALVWYWRLLSPRRGIVAYSLASHKVIRWFFPWLMIGTLAANIALLDLPFFRSSMLAQASFYGAAVVGWLADRVGLRLPLIPAIYHFTAMNAALLLGLFVYLRGIPLAAWQHSSRDRA